jgi:hypothetical protein
MIENLDLLWKTTIKLSHMWFWLIALMGLIIAACCVVDFICWKLGINDDDNNPDHPAAS